MTVTVNGEARDAREGATLLDLVIGSGRDPAAVAVALNGTVIPRGELGATRVAAGDRVEIVQAVGGG